MILQRMFCNTQKQRTYILCFYAKCNKVLIINLWQKDSLHSLTNKFIIGRVFSVFHLSLLPHWPNVGVYLLKNVSTTLVILKFASELFLLIFTRNEVFDHIL